MAQETFQFQAEVGKLLDIVAHSLYSEKEIFLRELISNASDACDKLRYAALTQPDLVADGGEFKISLAIDKKARTVSVTDNGIGMSRDELIENLGTIARSGTAAFVERLSGDSAADTSLIGQFGVGFYSVFTVADEVEVVSRRAGEKAAWRWVSDGKGAYSVAEAGDDAPSAGTVVTVHLRKDQKEFLEPERLRHVVKTYSDHIGFPVTLAGEDGEETINTASAIWTRAKKDISDDQYKEFYRHVGHAFDEPWMRLHYKAEGKIEYACLLFVPSARPLGLFDVERRHGVKLYVKRVFVTDDCEDLLPKYLRFLSGVIDSEDMPLNISRELLQHNPIVAKIRAGVVKRILGALAKKAEGEPEEYAAFWENFGAVLKEGIYEDAARRDELLAMARFRTTNGDGWTSLDDYLGRMKEGQDHIYYLSGNDGDALRANPHLEGYLSRGLEIIIASDPVDEFWIPAVAAYKEKTFRSITRGGAELDKFKPKKKSAKGKSGKPLEGSDLDGLIGALKLALADAVKDVRSSARLTDSPVCLVADEGDMDIHLERLLQQHRQIEGGAKRVLEINPDHEVIKRLAKIGKGDGGGDKIRDSALLLLDQARIAEGEPPADPAAFSRRLSGLMAKSLGA